jgi:hypothetical protein
MRVLLALHSQPFMGCTTGRHAEGRAEMEAAQIYQSGQFLQTEFLIQIVAHIGGHAFDLPIGQPAPRR